MKKIYTFLAALMAIAAMNAQTDLIISEYGEGWGSNKYLELYNPTNANINLKDYSIVRFSNGGQQILPAYTVDLPDYNLEPYKAYVITQDKRESAGTLGADDSPIWSQLEARGDLFVDSDYDSGRDGVRCIQWNGNDAVVLFKGSAIVDIFGTVGVDPAQAEYNGEVFTAGAWTSEPDYDDGKGIALSADHSLVRKSSVTNGITVNPEHFNIMAEYDTFPANTFENLGWHAFNGAPANALPVFDMDTLYAVSPFVEEGDPALTLTATDSDRGQNLEYYIVSGNFVYVDSVRHEPFSLDKNTGKIIVADELAIAEATEDIYFNVVACDEYGQSEVFSFDIRITEDDLSVNNLELVKTKLTPNPAERYFYVTSNKVISEVQVISLTGQELYQQAANASKVRVDLDLATGSYLVRSTYADHSVSVEKLIIK